MCLGQSRVDAALVLSDSPTLSFEDLLGISYQVAQGMDFLASKNVGFLSLTLSTDILLHQILTELERRMCSFHSSSEMTSLAQ